MFAVIIGWVFFSQTTPAAIGKMLGAMFGLGASCFADRASLYALKSGLILMIISVISCRPGLYQYFKRLARRNTYLAAVINAILFFLCIAYMIYSSYPRITSPTDFSTFVLIRSIEDIFSTFLRTVSVSISNSFDKTSITFCGSLI